MEIKHARIGVVSVLDAGTDEETAKEVYYWKAECGDQHGLFYSIENAISNAEYNGYTVVKEEQAVDLFSPIKRDKMINIIDAMGKVQQMSDEVYVMKRQQDSYHEKRYPLGTRFRMITGCNNSRELGYHFDREYVGVCPDGVDVARFIGVKRDDLKRIE